MLRAGPVYRVRSPVSATPSGVCRSVSPSSVTISAGVSASRSRMRSSPGLMCSLAAPAGRRVVPGEAEQVVALVERQVQPLRDRGDHLLRRLRPALPLQPRVVVGRHVAERGDLLAAQPARCGGAARAAVRRPRAAAPPGDGAQELGQSGSIDHGRPPVGAASCLPVRTRQPRIVRPWLRVAGRIGRVCMVRSHHRADHEGAAHATEVAPTSPSPTSPESAPWSPAPATASVSASPPRLAARRRRGDHARPQPRQGRGGDRRRSASRRPDGAGCRCATLDLSSLASVAALGEQLRAEGAPDPPPRSTTPA